MLLCDKVWFHEHEQHSHQHLNLEQWFWTELHAFQSAGILLYKTAVTDNTWRRCVHQGPMERLRGGAEGLGGRYAAA